MSVKILYCEGSKDSPDVRVLNNVLKACRVKPAGSKYSLAQNIRFIRGQRVSSAPIVAAIKDRDFDDDESSPVNSPQEWLVKDNDRKIPVGWYWERKEIENYLIDPNVVSQALATKAPPIEAYRAALEKSAKTIANYTAARIALSLSRSKKLLPLKNGWGKERGKDRHRFPDRFAESDCRTEIKDIVRQYEREKEITEKTVLETFERVLPSCREGGHRFKHFLTFFSGKDLLFAMESDLMGWQLGSPFKFRERILIGIENSPEDVCSWVPEWHQLR